MTSLLQIVLLKQTIRDPIPEMRWKNLTEIEPHKQADEVIREAEALRANIFNTPGNINNSFPRQMGSDKHTNHQQLALPSTTYDENYIIVGSHMDPALKEKMRKGEYVDFARILPKDKMQGEEDHRLELVYKGGQTFFI